MNEKDIHSNPTLENHHQEPVYTECEKGLSEAEKPLSKAQEKIRKTKIQTLNDTLRTTFLGGQVVMTRGIADLSANRRSEIIQKVQSYDDFSKDNDPYGEHDFGIIENRGDTIYWKIDYYDKALEYGSEDPSDPEVTTRVLTIMLNSEY